MKKIIGIIISLSFIVTSAIAQPNFVVGVKAGHGTLDADTKETTNLASEAETKNVDADSPYGSIFAEVEMQIPANDKFKVALGVEYIPFDANIAVNTQQSKTSGTISDHTTIYVQPSADLGPVTVFGRLGYSQADIGKNNSSVSNSGSTVSSFSSDMEGVTYGLGLEKNFDVLFLRAEYMVTDYDSLQATNSNNNKITADADTEVVAISIGKRF